VRNVYVCDGMRSRDVTSRALEDMYAHLGLASHGVDPETGANYCDILRRERGAIFKRATRARARSARPAKRASVRKAG